MIFAKNGLNLSKGPYSFAIHSYMGLIDCHGICANDEMTHIIIQQIKYGEEGLKKLINNFYYGYYESKEYKDALISLKRIDISPEEKKEIDRVIAKLRGPHDCVYNYR
jgi:hypothetical protein